MQKRILIIDDHDDLETLLSKEFSAKGHLITSTEDRNEAVDLLESEDFDLIITDLDGEHLIASKNGTDDNLSCLPDNVAESRSNIKAFKLCISNYKTKNFAEDELKYFVETILNFKARCVDKKEVIQDWHEKIEFEVPSYVSLMHDILGYLMKRVEKSGVVNPETSNLFRRFRRSLCQRRQTRQQIQLGKTRPHLGRSLERRSPLHHRRRRRRL